jgi:hypothetical protein
VGRAPHPSDAFPLVCDREWTAAPMSTGAEDPVHLKTPRARNLPGRDAAAGVILSQSRTADEGRLLQRHLEAQLLEPV